MHHNKYILFFLLLLNTTLLAKTGFETLEDSVYYLNNNFNYTKSQNLILSEIENNNGNTELFKYYILLSHTHKRVYDYTSCRLALDQAFDLSKRSKNPSFAKSIVQYEQALMEFDLTNYQKSLSLMDGITEEDFQLFNNGKKSNIKMQRAYLHFLDKDYSKAEIIYEEAAIIKKNHDRCNLPMILVKQMELYYYKGDNEKLNEAFNQSLFYADSCGILKYRLYTYEMLEEIFLDNEDLNNWVQIKNEVKKVREAYNSEQHQISLSKQKETFTKTLNEQKVRGEKRRNTLLRIVVGLLSLLLLCLWFAYNTVRKQRLYLNQENENMRARIKQYSININSNNKERDGEEFKDSFLSKFGLTERQIDIVRLIIDGKTNKEIAEKSFISVNTVKYHIKKIYELLEVKSRKELSGLSEDQLF